MNLLIETLNVWADHAHRFAWPMLWQSSLLIVLLFALDLLTRRRLRPAVRYALWLVVLVKLLLPPSLAFPTGPGWWLRPAKAAPARPRPTTPVVVTYDAHAMPAPSFTAAPVFIAPPPPRLTPASWTLVGMAAVSLGLLAWMLARWRQVAREARRSSAAPASLSELFTELRRPVRLKLTDHPLSPAVCGLFRPVILLPRSLVEHLPPEQLRTVLLHELLHLRRGDVWVNCLQALLQIAYWWHPLLWLANARIRRVREEAVDDGVMLALNENAETYAPTLLEVAKLALHRPLASLGLVGILESRSFLRRRIERLMDFHPPRRAGLTLGSALAVLGFAAMAVPMGKAPAPSEVPQSAASLLTTNNLASDGLSSSGMAGEPQPLYIRTFKINEITLVEGLHVPLGLVATNSSEAIFHALLDHLSQAGVDLDPVCNPGKSIFYTDRSGMLLVRATLQDLDIIERKIAALRIAAGSQPAPGTVQESPSGPVTTNGLVSNRLSDPDLTAEQKVKASTLVQDGKLLYEMDKLDEAQAKLKLALKEDPNNQTALYYPNLVSEAKYTRAAKLHRALAVPTPYSRTNLVSTNQGRQTIIAKLDRIRPDRVSFDGLPLSEVVRFLADESRKGDPEQRGINFILNQNINSGTSAADATSGPDRQPLPPGPAEQVDLSSIAINLKYPLTNIRLADVLDAIVKVADRPIKYSIEDYGVVFSARARQQSPPLYVRTFKVDPNTILEVLEGLPLAKSKAKTNDVQAVTRALRNYFASLGVDLDSTKNPEKALFYNDRQGTLVIRATMQDLEIIEAAIHVLNSAPPQINLKFRIEEVPETNTNALGFDWYLGNVLMNTGSSDSSNRVPSVAYPLGTFPGNPPPDTLSEPTANAHILAPGLRNAHLQSFTLSGILTDPQFRMVIHALEQRSGAELVGQPEVTTSSGRQVQCKTTEIHNIAKINAQALTPPGVARTNDDESALYVTEPMEFGVVLDATPTVLEDGYTIRMPLLGTVQEFLGYEDPRTNRVAVYVSGKQKWATPPTPSVRTQQMSSTVNVYDGQTLVLEGLVSEDIIAFKDKVPVLGDLPLVGRLFRSESKNAQKRNLLIFVTPTIIDPTGNRVHSPDKNPSSPNEIPAQPPR
jgi:type II secretory pathway component GspD/PulD (secretin)/beta-lactamase regulating signal transducer with metallopeptidase domain